MGLDILRAQIGVLDYDNCAVIREDPQHAFAIGCPQGLGAMGP
jgi:hypothetical protein